MFPDHRQLVSFDRDEFATAFNWAMNAASGKAEIADPSTFGLDFDEADGTPMQVRFTNTPVTRLLFAVRERYVANDPEKCLSAIFRVWALMDLLHSGRLDPWVRTLADGSEAMEIATAVIYAAAVVPLNKEYQFPWYAFLSKVRQIEAETTG